MQPLPAKETALFRSIIKLFDFKQYKRGLKTADQILKKFPEHGETHALRGLMLDSLGRREEALENIRKGLRFDLNSHVCWHVFGIWHRNGKDYDESVKCYLNALKHDKENLQVLRDLSLMQVQLRDFEGYHDTRHQLLALRPENRMSWMGLAVSYHLLHNYEMAINVLRAYEETLSRSVGDPPDIEHSEMLLYHNMLLRESKRYQDALTHLKLIEPDVLDKGAWKELLADTLKDLGDTESARKEYGAMLQIQPENGTFLDKWLSCHTGTPLVTLLMQLRVEYPTSILIQKKCLNALSATSPEFTHELARFLSRGIEKGIPSFSTSLKSLYKDKEKSLAIETWLVNEEKRRLPESQKTTAARSLTNNTHANDTHDTVPGVIWVWYFLAQHWDRMGDLTRALEAVQRALLLAPDLCELHAAHARVLKHAGALKEAAISLEKARKLDLSDRFLNTKSAKYHLRADEAEKAEAIALEFAKGEKGQLNFVDMQCVWYATEAAKSAARSGQHGMAMKQFLTIDKFFSIYFHDQFDFHAYCFRKMTLRSYLRMIHFEDELYRHPYYRVATYAAVNFCLELHDNRLNEQMMAARGETALAGLSESDRKKMISKQRRAEARAKAQTIEATAEKKLKEKPKTPGGAIEEEMTDEQLVQPGVDFLAYAMRFLQHLLPFAGTDVMTCALAAEVYRRRWHEGQPQPLALFRVIRLGRDHVDVCPEMHTNDVLSSHLDGYVDAHPAVQQVFQETRQELYGSMSWKERNEMFLRRHSDSLPHRVAAARVLWTMGDQVRAQNVIVETNLTQTTAAHCVKAHHVLKLWGSEQTSTFAKACHERFPHAEAFAC